MFSFSTSIEGCLFLSTPFISSVAAEAFWIKQGGYFWLFGFCSRRTDLYVYPGNDLLNHTFEQSQRAPCLHLPQPVLRALPQCGFHYKQEPLQHFLPYYSIFHYAGRRTTRENQPLLRKELIKPIGGQKCFSTHMYFCQRCDDGEWVEPYPISVVQQRDIIRINWEWTSRQFESSVCRGYCLQFRHICSVWLLQWWSYQGMLLVASSPPQCCPMLGQLSKMINCF